MYGSRYVCRQESVMVTKDIAESVGIMMNPEIK